jgi:ABC-type iron transport system FetAB permease component
MAGTPNKIIYTQELLTAAAICVAAKATYTDNVNAVKLLTAGANGALVKSIKAIARGTVTPTQLQLYLKRPTDAAYYMLPLGAMLAGYTMAASTANTPAAFAVSASDPLRLGAGDEVWCAIGVALAAGVVFEAEFENF